MKNMKNMRRILSVSLCVLLLVNIIVPFTTLAADGGTVNTVNINNAADLTRLAEQCVLDTWSKDKMIVLRNDINLSNTEFSSIPLFMGHFDGCNHTISGLDIGADASITGLFRQILKGGVVENLNVSGIIAPGGTAEIIGGIAGENNGTIKNCTFTGTVTGSRCIGGIVGINGDTGMIEKCAANGKVEGQHRIGGIAGENQGALLDCRNRADVNTEYTYTSSTNESNITYSADNLINNNVSTEELADIADLGGIAGYSEGTVQSCVNDGNAGYLHVGYNVGGIVGHQFGLTEDCKNNGKILGRKDVGGIVGQLEPDTKWDYDNSRLKQLQGMINELQTRMNRLSQNVGEERSAISDELSKALNALENTGSSVKLLVDGKGSEAADIESNLELRLRVYRLRGELDVIIDELNNSAGKLPESDDQFTDALDKIKSAVSGAQTAANQMRAELDNLYNELNYVTDSRDSVNKAIGNIESCIEPVRAEFNSARAALDNALAAGKVSDNTEAMENALSTVNSTIEFADYAKRQLSDGSTGTDKDSSTRNDVLSSLGEVNSALQSMNGKIKNNSVMNDLQAVSEQMTAIMNLMFGIVSDNSGVNVGVSDYFNDISTKDENHTTGMVKACVNQADVNAETNVGGIAGAVTIELAFDQEDELNISSMAAGSLNYLIYAALRDCVNASLVSASKTASGGIAGRMDHGAVIECESSGIVTSSGTYAGGIAGYCVGTIKNCCARANISAQNNAGGIAGYGKDLSGCLSMPNIYPDVEFQGSVAGTVGGTLSKNYYAESKIGGVNGFSFEGKAQEVSYDTLLKLSENKELFRTITVTFISGDKIISAITVPFGGSVKNIPSVPDSGGKYWKWDDFDNTAIYRSMTIKGRYCSPITSLASSEKIPNFIVEGAFYDGQSLTVLSYTADVSALGLADDDIIDANTLSVNNYDKVLTVRMREEAEGKLFIWDKNDGLKPCDFTRDGSYIVFDLDNGGSFVYVKWKESVLPWIVGGGIIILAMGAGIVILLLLRKKKKRLNDAAAQIPEDLSE